MAVEVEEVEAGVEEVVVAGVEAGVAVEVEGEAGEAQAGAGA